MSFPKRRFALSFLPLYPLASRWRVPHPRNHRPLFIFLSVLLLLLLPEQVAADAPVTTLGITVVNKGVVLFNEVLQTAAGLEHICMIDIDLDQPNIRLGVVQAHNHLVSLDEPLSSMANRTGALAGINGDYFQINGPGRPIGMVVRDGRLLQTPTNDSFYAVLGVNPAGRLTIGPEFFSGTITDGKASYTLHEINIYSDIRKGPILITPDLGTGLSVRGETVALLQPAANTDDTFTVQSVQSHLAWLPALSGHDALLGVGADGSWLAGHLHPHDQIHVTEHISPDSNLVQAVGGGPIILKNGSLYYDAHPPAPSQVYVRDPLTAIGTNKDGTHARLIVFDGRNAGPWKSAGMTYSQAASYLLAQGISNAMLFDTGGSSELVTQLPGHSTVSIINSPSSGYERPVANGLFVYAARPVIVVHILPVV